ncbi:MAG: trigger factor [Pirellulales bacterium]
MSTDDQESTAATAEAEIAEEKQRMTLDVKIEKRNACERHITVTIPREDIERYYDKEFGEIVEKAQVPGFRQGRVPRKLVESKFRKEVAERIKGALVLDSLSQLSEDHKLAAISEPDLDAEAIILPDEGAMTYEFNLEVRPEFDLPQWSGMTLERPVRDISEKDVENRLKQILTQHGKLVPHDGPAGTGDYLSVNLVMKNGEEVLSTNNEAVIRIRPTLSFRDGKIDGFDKLMQGVKAGETRQGTAKLTEDAPNPDLRGKDVTATFEVLEVKKLQLPELTPAFIKELGDFDGEGDLRDAIKSNLERQISYQQQQRARQQILQALTVSADWDLPKEMLERQSGRELERAKLELRRSGYSDAEIRAHENELRQNSRVNTMRALKEHFVLERIAEDEKIEAAAADYELEIVLIAQQSGESPRRVRAQLEKRGLMDTLRNQIIERKVIELILEKAKFKDVPFEFDTSDAEALDQSAGGGDESSDSDEAIPQAQPGNDPVSQLPKKED